MASPSWYTQSTPTSGPDDERPLGELFSDMTRSLQTLVRKEVELAKVEVKEQASRAAKAGAMFGGGAGAAFFAVLLFSFAAAWGLAQLIPTPLGFFVVGLVYAVVAAVLFARGRRQAAAIQPPKQMMETVKQDVQVAKDSISRGMSGDTYANPWRTKPWESPRR